MGREHKNQEKKAKKRIPYKKAPYERWPVIGIPKHMTRKHRVLMWTTTIAVFSYVLWRLFFTMPWSFGIFSAIAGVLLFLAEITSFIILLSNFREGAHYVEPELPVMPLSWYPDVDILITTHNETVELMYKTLNACTFLNYPDKRKVHVWLCDDNNRPEMAQLAQQLGVGYFGMEGNTAAKAGNMNNAFWQTSAPLVVTVDADMILSSDFLMETVPYFFLPYLKKEETGEWVPLPKDEVDPDYKVGFVQSPQSFYNPDLFQFNLYSEQNIPNEQDYFFTEVNVAKNNDNSAQYAGSNTILSREALTDINGFAEESITEDFLTGLMILQSGYRNYAIPQQLAHGLSPDSIGSLMSQRERWARGNVQAFKSLRIFTSRHLNIWQKIELTGTFCYWLSFISRMIYILAPIMATLFNIRFFDAPIWQTLAFWLPHYLLFYYATKVFSSNTRSSHWTHVVDTIMAPYLTLPTIKELIGIKQKKFVVTNKAKSENQQAWNKGLYALPHAVLLLATLISIFVIIRRSIVFTTLYNPLVLFWLIAGAKDLLFAVFFMLGRVNYRSSERFFVRAPVRVNCNGTVSDGFTSDVSDNGIAAVFNTPLNCRSDDLVDVNIQTELYSAYAKCKVVNVKQQKGQEVNDNERKWKYGFVIEEISDEDKRQYLQILYDRPHSLPKRFAENNSVFDDINTNLMRRTHRKEVNMRKIPRIKVELPFQTEEGYNGTLHDFNFEFAFIDISKDLKPSETLTLYFGDGLDLVLVPRIVGENQKILYRIVNAEDILKRPDFTEVMERWVELETASSFKKPLGQGYVTSLIEQAQ